MTLNEIEWLYVIPVVLLTQFIVMRQYVHSQLLLLLHHCVKCTLSPLLLSTCRHPYLSISHSTAPVAVGRGVMPNSGGLNR